MFVILNNTKKYKKPTNFQRHELRYLVLKKALIIYIKTVYTAIFLTLTLQSGRKFYAVNLIGFFINQL